jgi:hypothetical protein
MKICNAFGGAPATVLAVFSRAAYRLADAPASGTIQWSLQGDVGPIRFEGSDKGEQIMLVTAHASGQVQAITLTATFTPSDLSPAITASITLTVFAVSIRDADGAGTPVMSLGIGNRARYVAATTPDIGPLSPTWTQGSQRGIALAGGGPSGEIEVLGESVTSTGHDATLCVSIAVGEQVARAVLPIVVFGVEMELITAGLDSPIPAGGELGVGETRMALARFVPAHAEPPDGVARRTWSTAGGLQLMLGGDGSADVTCIGTAPGAGRIEVELSHAGSTVRAHRELVVFGVNIVGADGGEPPLALAVGQSMVVRADIDPPAPGAQLFWTATDRIAVQAASLAAEIVGVEAGSADGRDGLSVTALIGTAQARGLIPLVIYRAMIVAADGGVPAAAVPGNGRVRYRLKIDPPLPQAPSISWAVNGKAAALSGPTTEEGIELVAAGQSEQAGDTVLTVSVAAPGIASDVPTATHRITVGTPRRS